MRVRARCKALILPILTAACAAAPVRERPVPFSESRVSATRRYIEAHYGAAEGIEIDPKIVVLHWTGIPTLEGSWKAFAAERLPPHRGDIAGGGDVNVSAHFLVDRDGTIYRLMPETWMARHVIGLNLSAIGIENVGGKGGVDDLTEAQLKANVRLVRELKERHPGIEYVIGHHEYLVFEGTELWREKDPGYRTKKSDPGDRFVDAVRAYVRDLGLKPAPQFGNGRK